MTPRPTLEADDLVTPTQAGRLLGIPGGTVRQWILRYHLEPLGTLGRWPAYDYNDIAAVDARLRRKREAQPAALHRPREGGVSALVRLPARRRP